MSNSYEKDQAWQEDDSNKIDPPLPLFRELPPGQEFPLGSLGEALEKAALSIKAASGAPSGLIGQSLIAAASLATQAHANVEIDGRKYPTSLFCLSIGASGERKSFVDSEALNAHREYEKQMLSKYEEEIEIFNVEQESYEHEKRMLMSKHKSSTKKSILDALKNLGASPKFPKSEIMLMEEPTYEGVVKALENGRPSIGLFSDEGGRMIGGHAMSKENQLKTIAGLCSIWDGKPISRTRAGEGSSKIYGKRMSLHLMIQPKVSELILGNEIILDQGFLARCLMVSPVTTIGSRPYRDVNLNEDKDILNYRSIIKGLLCHPLPKMPNTNDLAPRALMLAPAEKNLWILFHDHVEENMQTEKSFAEIRSFASKAPEQVLRIAGVLSLMEDLEATYIKYYHLESAIHLVTFYLSEAVRLRGLSSTNPDLVLSKKLLTWCQKFDEIYLVQIYQNGPFALRDKESAKKAIKILEEHNMLHKIDGRTIDGAYRKDVWAVSHVST